MKILPFFLFVLVLQSACVNKESFEMENPSSVHKYLFLGHIYERENTIDSRVESADRSGYQQIWLGGDICSETTQEEATLEYLDELFDLSSPNTHWSLGNHDIRNGNESWITNRTGRKTFYATHFNGITLLVLNTRLRSPDDCERMDEQYELIQSVCDTISYSSHLVVLSHDVVWGEIDEAMLQYDFANANAGWIPLTCITGSNQRFEGIVLPELIRVQERGTSVICIAGDLGQKVSAYEFINDNGILFFGSGITSETDWNQQFPTAGQRDKVLRCYHDLVNRELTWEFIYVEDI